MSEGGSLDQASIIAPISSAVPVTLQEPGTMNIAHYRLLHCVSKLDVLCMSIVNIMQVSPKLRVSHLALHCLNISSCHSTTPRKNWSELSADVHVF